MDRVTRRVILLASFALSCARESAPPPVPLSGAAIPAAPGSAAAGSNLPGLDSRAIAPAHRQIIRNAELSLEADDPARAGQEAIAIAERLRGFALTSEALRVGQAPGRSELHVNLVLRVPTEAFGAALQELRALGRGAGREQVSGEDVSEEYVDLDARIRTERALEAQLLEILKSTKAVTEMMEVHGRLATVRGEIEKMEGRRRFLDSQTSLSTIRLQILAPEAHAVPGLADTVRLAVGDLRAVASVIVTGTIRVAGVLLPVLVLILLPGFAIVRAAVRIRARRTR
jgi:hypothetical protein